MKNIIRLIALSCGISLLSIGILSASTQPEYEEGRVIVKVKGNVSNSQRASFLQSLGLHPIRQLGLIDAEVCSTGNMTTQQAIQACSADPNIEYIEPDYKVYASTAPNDPSFPLSWSLNNTGQTGGTPDADIDALSAWEAEGDETVIIGVIDSGVDYNHEDLAANMWVNPGEIAGDGIDNDGNGYVDDVYGYNFARDINGVPIGNPSDPMDSESHGTHIAGIIAAERNNNRGIAGVSGTTKIMALRFLTPNSAGDLTGSFSDAIDCIDYAIQMGAHLTNNSWGGTGFSQSLEEAIERARDAGQLFVAAAGNSNVNDSIPDILDNDILAVYPASYDLPNIISVASTDHNDLRSSFSHFGAISVDLGAPGGLIYSTEPGSTYDYKSGTSMAAPHVAGAASLILSTDLSLGYQDVKDIILSNVDPNADLASITLTGGRLNAGNLFSLLFLDSVAEKNLTLSNYQAVNLIEAFFTIGTGRNVTFTVTNNNGEIILGEGFHAEEGSTFTAQIQ